MTYLGETPGCPTPGCGLVVGRLGGTSWWGCPNGHRTRTPMRDDKPRSLSIDQRLEATAAPPTRTARRLPNRHDVKRTALAEIRELLKTDPFE